MKIIYDCLGEACFAGVNQLEPDENHQRERPRASAEGSFDAELIRLLGNAPRKNLEQRKSIEAVVDGQPVR